MTIRRTINHGFTVDTWPLDVMPDGSGAPTTIKVGPFQYACDYLGEIKLRLISPVSRAKPYAYADAAKVARETYAQALFECTDQAWLDANHSLYRVTCEPNE